MYVDFKDSEFVKEYLSALQQVKESEDCTKVIVYYVPSTNFGEEQNKNCLERIFSYGKD